MKASVMRIVCLELVMVVAISGTCSAAVVDDAPSRKLQSKVTATSTAKSVPPAKKKLPPKRDLIAESRRLLRAESQAKSLSEQIRLTVKMSEMSYQFSTDPRFAQSPTLQEARGLLHSRLRAIKKRTLAAQRRQKRKPTKIKVDRKALAQLNQALNGPGANGNIANQLADHGPMLVELIQRTISPKSWDVNGGASTIRYWRPGMALVVRAPEGLHEKVGPVLQQLRVR